MQVAAARPSSAAPVAATAAVARLGGNSSGSPGSRCVTRLAYPCTSLSMHPRCTLTSSAPPTPALQRAVSARARDPEALEAPDDDDPEAANKIPPNLFWRCFAALCYLVPWIDSMSLGRAMHSRFRNLLLINFVPGLLCTEGGRASREVACLLACTRRLRRGAHFESRSRSLPPTPQARSPSSTLAPSLRRSSSSSSCSFPLSRTTSCTTLCASTACRYARHRCGQHCGPACTRGWLASSHWVPLRLSCLLRWVHTLTADCCLPLDHPRTAPHLHCCRPSCWTSW